MPHKAALSLAAAFIIGIASLSTISSDASARAGARAGGRAGAAHVGGAGVHRGTAYRGTAHRGYVGAPVRRGVAVGVGAAAVGAAGAYGAYSAPACGYYPYPPCY